MTILLATRDAMLACMVTADQLVLHALGDYVIQSDWMAQEKTKRAWPALVHVVTYVAPFALLTRSPLALAVMAATHFAIDRYRLARYVCWAKNWIGPRYHPWAACKGTGYVDTRPPWLSVWLMIIADNVMHVAINGAAIKFL